MTSALYAVSMADGGGDKYRQIAGDLRADILSGKYPPESQLPSLADLKAKYGVSDGPVNQAMRMLRDEGLARSEQGRGSFALKPPEPGPSQYEIVISRLDDLTARVMRLETLREGEPDQEP